MTKNAVRGPVSRQSLKVKANEAKPEEKTLTIIPRLLTPRECAAALHVSAGTLSVWRSTKRYFLPHVKVGRKVYYTDTAVAEFIAARTVGGAR